jgi:hypothetical protein
MMPRERDEMVEDAQVMASGPELVLCALLATEARLIFDDENLACSAKVYPEKHANEARINKPLRMSVPGFPQFLQYGARPA